MSCAPGATSSSRPPISGFRSITTTTSSLSFTGLPPPLREWLTFKIRRKRYPPSEYVSIPSLKRLLLTTPGVRSVSKATRIYFFPSFGDAWGGLAGSQVALKRIIFALVAPVHAVLRVFGQSGDLILPSIRVVWRIDK